ncbi:Queuosine biosynthesis QueD, PTPS-I [Liberibacter crescens BT-1]|uniref:6-carboxy-5,6,7,8-tetrahydropterin synthase n=1 Tax=Liberibacter crescens (strain BT-1) TaxID=1215343 RepID=L0ET90_LIBCB|nr:6-carboxytetrahydropterin synthase QueD [Liberibacter crescens]AGA64754.1 Queuosine biosynthesis QueD, PTPS-I [Liberibacter crescens BT-1]AMC13366.1 6-carboxy-5,6,7,8-tetrahydropterin synthase [Liberibacter crescens]
MKITQAFTFEAAHHLSHLPKTHKCHRMHGHSYRVEITLQGNINPETGFVEDFFNIESSMSHVLALLDHQSLNDIDGLEKPSVENIALWIWNKINHTIPLLFSVRVYETSMSWAEYQGE